MAWQQRARDAPPIRVTFARLTDRCCLCGAFGGFGNIGELLCGDCLTEAPEMCRYEVDKPKHYHAARKAYFIHLRIDYPKPGC